MIRRLLFLVTIIPISLVTVLLVVVPSILWAALAWIMLGPDEKRTDRILLNPVADWLLSWPERLLGRPLI